MRVEIVIYYQINTAPVSSEISINGPDSFHGALIMFVIGLCVTGFGIYDYTQQSDAIADAVEVDATITETGVEPVRSSTAGGNYKPRIEFTYQYQGESYTGSNLFPSATTKNYDTQSAAETAIEDYEVGSTTTAYLDPEVPADAFLKDTESNSPLLFAFVGGLFVLFGGRSILTNR